MMTKTVMMSYYDLSRNLHTHMYKFPVLLGAVLFKENLHTHIYVYIGYWVYVLDVLLNQ